MTENMNIVMRTITKILDTRLDHDLEWGKSLCRQYIRNCYASDLISGDEYIQLKDILNAY